MVFKRLSLARALSRRTGEGKATDQGRRERVAGDDYFWTLMGTE
jgi:hypothetical protein